MQYNGMWRATCKVCASLIFCTSSLFCKEVEDIAPGIRLVPSTAHTGYDGMRPRAGNTLISSQQNTVPYIAAVGPSLHLTDGTLLYRVVRLALKTRLAFNVENN